MSEKSPLRGQVAKHEALFIRYVKEYGAEQVRKILMTGKCDGYTLKICLNKKDRFQMLQLLNLHKPDTPGGE